MRYSYFGSSSNARYEVKPQDVKVDRRRKMVVITAKHTGYGYPEITSEYPFLRVSLCEKCGEPVSIYAQGNLRDLLLQTNLKSIFEPPTSRWARGWRLIEEEGGFALVAASGHKWDRGAHGQPNCHGKPGKVVSS